MRRARRRRVGSLGNGARAGDDGQFRNWPERTQGSEPTALGAYYERRKERRRDNAESRSRVGVTWLAKCWINSTSGRVMSTYLKLSVTRRAFLKGALATGAASYLSPLPFAHAAVDPWRTADEIVSSIQPPKIPQRAFPITRFGARSDGVTDSTAAIAAAIEACRAAGGGRVMVPEGVYLTGAIRLKSRVNLHLVAGSTLKFSTDPRKYPNVLTRWEGNDLFNYSPLVYAFREKDIAITGEGTLDGQ